MVIWYLYSVFFFGNCHLLCFLPVDGFCGWEVFGVKIIMTLENGDGYLRLYILCWMDCGTSNTGDMWLTPAAILGSAMVGAPRSTYCGRSSSLYLYTFTVKREARRPNPLGNQQGDGMSLKYYATPSSYSRQPNLLRTQMA